jgi:energy-coupling factor transporter transmembrane protein EcfT
MAICKPMTVINKIRGHLDAIIRAIVISVAIVVAWNVPYAWYWRVVAFVAIMFIVGIIYPTVQFELAKPLGIKNMPPRQSK